MDEETLAWRTIGIVERMCLEKGLHRRETLNHPTVVAAGRDRVLRLFWSIYTLDMRWSFGTGLLDLSYLKPLTPTAGKPPLDDIYPLNSPGNCLNGCKGTDNS